MKLISTYKNSTTLPWPSGIMASAYLAPMTKSIGSNVQYRALYDLWDGKTADWYFDSQEVANVTPTVLEKMIKDPQVVEHCRVNYLKNINLLLRLLDSNHNNWSKLTDLQLAKLLKKVVNLYHTAGYYVEPPDFSMELGGQDLVKQLFVDYLKSKNINLKQSELDGIFSALTAFTKPSFSQRAELSLLNICLISGKTREQSIDKHVRQFYWQFYDYYGPILDREVVVEELRAYENLNKKEIRCRIKNIQQSLSLAVAEQKAIMKKYALNNTLKNAFKILRDFGFLYSDTKKEYTTKANIALADLLHFIARKHGIDEYLIHFASVEEVMDLLTKGQKIKSSLLDSRSKGFILRCLPAKEGYFSFLDKQEQEKVFDSIVKDNVHVSLLKGMPACPGNYKGNVRIIKNASQISKFEKGEVLVAPMTAVNYLPAMKKAGAIVTDLGGVTCHAAIVSRELGIPCIIATKIATQALKNGDMVEVDADHGIVRKIKD